MSSGDVSETSKIANVRIYVEQAIGRLKHFVSWRMKFQYPVCLCLTILFCLQAVGPIMLHCLIRFISLQHIVIFHKRKKMCMMLYKFVVICFFLLMVRKRSFCLMKQLYCLALVYLYSKMHKLIFKMVIIWL
jgi:hypothetical protein